MKKILMKIIAYSILVLCAIFLMIPPMLYFYYRRFVYVSASAVDTQHNTILVLGAGIKQNTTPSSALQDRLDLAYELYASGKVDKIIVSGARDSEYYDEPKVMKAQLVLLGVDSEVIIEDPAGFRTFESCRRAVEEYKLSEVIVLSQGFHLPRALFLCRSVGLEATGVYSTGSFSTYYSRWYTIREVLAMYVAVYDVVRYTSQ